MPRIKEVTYQKVTEVADRLIRENRRVNTRAVQAETGGSMNTVNEYLREWRRQRSEEGGGTITLSEQLRGAIEAEIRQHTASLREELQKQTREAELREAENLELLKEAETRIEELYAELEREKEGSERAAQEAETKVALYEQRALAAEQKSRELEERLASVQREISEADKRAAAAEGRSSAMTNHLKHLEQENARLSASLDTFLRERRESGRKKREG